MNTPTWTIRRYTPADKKQWNEFVANSRNATFLFVRDYMDYHADRFADHSLMAYRNGRLSAILPAHTDGATLCSHRGLSYGGWILPKTHVDCSDYLQLWDVWFIYCREERFAQIDYKALPHIYASAPSDEDLYALWRHNAELIEASPSATIDLNANPGFNQMRRRHLRATDDIPYTIKCADSEADYLSFHTMLSECLAERHGAKPVHSVDEMMLLASRFPSKTPNTLGRISLYLLCLEGKAEAGVWIFSTPSTVHAQYIATTEKGRKSNLLTPLFEYLIVNARELFFPTTRYFDFGISTENHGLNLNEGLYRQKSSFGATASICSRYRITVNK